jgi:hypothetical protein
MAGALALSAMPASGGVILEIGSVFASPGSTGTIEVDLQNTGSSTIVVAGFNFEIAGDSDIDFTGAGFSTTEPYIFADDSADQALSFPLNSSTGASLLASDFSFSGLGDALGAGQTAGLALVTFSVSSTAALGPVSILFSTDIADTNLSDPLGGNIPITTFESGTIDVMTPEPSAAAMLLAALIGLGALRWSWAKNSWRPLGPCVQRSQSCERASARHVGMARLSRDKSVAR